MNQVAENTERVLNETIADDAEALAICHAASDLYARNLMRKDAEELCNRLPVGFYSDQRAAIPGNNRQGWCMEAATRNASVV